MRSVDGTLVQKGTGRTVDYRVDYDVVGNNVNYKAVVTDGSTTLESPAGQFEFDAARLDAKQAVASFLQAHVDMANYDAAAAP